MIDFHHIRLASVHCGEFNQSLVVATIGGNWYIWLALAIALAAKQQDIQTHNCTKWAENGLYQQE